MTQKIKDIRASYDRDVEKLGKLNDLHQLITGILEVNGSVERMWGSIGPLLRGVEGYAMFDGERIPAAVAEYLEHNLNPGERERILRFGDSNDAHIQYILGSKSRGITMQGYVGLDKVGDSVVVSNLDDINELMSAVSSFVV